MRHPEPGLSDVALTRDWPNEFETENATPNLHRYRAGLALGGPIVKNRTFFYAGFEREHNRSLEDSYISKPLEDAIIAFSRAACIFALRQRGLQTTSFLRLARRRKRPPS